MHETACFSTMGTEHTAKAPVPSARPDRAAIALQSTPNIAAHGPFASTTSMEVHHDEVHKRHPSANWLHSASIDGSSTLTSQFLVRPYGERARLAELIEVQRQIGLLHSHRVLGVSTREIFVLEEISLTLRDGALLSQPTPLRGTVTTGATPYLRGGRAHRAEHHVRIETDSGLTATGSSTAFYVPAKTHRRLQNRLHDDVVVVPPAPGATMRATLTIDTRDPILSDHQNDHISAMAVICALETFFLEHSPGLDLKSLRLSFEQYLDSDTPAEIAFRFPAAAVFEGEVLQQDAPRARFTGSLAERGE